MILSVQNISKSFEDNLILDNISFNLEDNDKAALIGINGAGKTTLLNIIMGNLDPDTGNVSLSKDTSVGYLSQESTVDSDNDILSELMLARKDLIDMEDRLRRMEAEMADLNGRELDSHMDAYDKLSVTFKNAGGLTYKSEINGIINGLGFIGEDKNKPINQLSGGQKTRVALSRLLIKKPDLIILDEPTNHLDLNAIAFLENYLTNYKGAVLVVSHDRYFLDKVVNKVIEIEDRKGMVFKGNYSDYAVKKEALRNERLNAYYKQQSVIEHQEKVIKKLQQFNREKSIKRAESRKKALAKIKRIEKTAQLNDAMNLALSPDVTSGNDVLKVRDLTKAYDGHVLFENISFDITRGETIALVGANGTGKTTLLKIINGIVKSDSGEYELGTNVHIGYYDQEHHVLHEDKTLFDELQDEHPDMNNTEIRNTLAAFLFTGDDVFKKIGNLSGGEKGRVSLAKLMLSKGNFLILDEPTNHLDITSKEILEDALNAYEGTVLYVSHDRYFINRTAGRIIELEDHGITEYLGDYDYYVEKKSQINGTVPDASAICISGSVNIGNSEKEPAQTSNGADDYKAQKEQNALKRKNENELKRCEERISKLESENKELEDKMSDPAIATSSVKLQEITSTLDSNNTELQELYLRWEELETLLH
ncbi:MAG: ABC-F type ribosomal protection protein [Lachnospiraceae bacterium]|nr:ABC-F type ribosomal protection protein [Lachnospiraceae bacterium]